MVIPPWLASLTGAQAFAQNPANGYQPTIGDALQGIGHSMMEHYRAGQAGPAMGGKAPLAPAAPVPLAPTPAPPVVPGQMQPYPGLMMPRPPPVVFQPGVIPPTMGSIAGLFR